MILLALIVKFIQIVTLFATSGPKGTTAVQAKTHLATKTGNILKVVLISKIRQGNPSIHSMLPEVNLFRNLQFEEGRGIRCSTII